MGERVARTSTGSAVCEGVAVVGVGNWGTSLLTGLRGAGVRVCEAVHAHGGVQAAKEGVPLETALLDARVLWLCVPDRAIAETAERVARRRPDLQGQLLVHSSGALSSLVLARGRAAGAEAASVHPFMSFPTKMPVPLAGVRFGVETPSAAARGRLEELVRRLGGIPFALTAEGKALYHAAGTMASPLLTSLLATALECCAAAGVERREALALLGPIAQRTVENIVRDGPEHSFSGPIARGDADTIKLHLHALAEHPLWANVYRSLLGAALELLPSARTEELRALMQDKTDR